MYVHVLYMYMYMLVQWPSGTTGLFRIFIKKEDKAPSFSKKKRPGSGGDAVLERDQRKKVLDSSLEARADTS